MRAELAEGNRGAPVAARSTTRWPPSTPRPASRRSSSSIGAGRHRSCCAGTAATSRPAPTASVRSSTTRPARRCAATTAVGRRRSRRAARPARRRGSATSAAARSGSSARSARRIPTLRVARLDRDVADRRGAAERVIDAFTRGRDRRPGRHEPRRQGPRRAVGHARRRRLIRRRPQPARRAGRGADVPAPAPGGRAGRPWRATRPRDPADLPAGAPGHPRRRVRRRRAAASTTAELDLRRRFGSPPFGSLVKLTVALPIARRRSARARRWRTGCASGPPELGAG